MGIALTSKVLIGLMIAAFLLVMILCIAANYVRQHARVQAPTSKPVSGIARARIENEIKRTFAAERFTSDIAFARLRVYKPEDIFATLVDMLKRQLLHEEEDPVLGFLYSVRSG